LRDWRTGELRKVFAETAKRDQALLTLADVQSLVAAAESTQDPDECVKYCKLALQRGVTLDEAYLPWLRSLIAADRLREAEADLDRIEPSLSSKSFVHQMHLFLSLKYFVNEHEPLKAAPHIDAYFDWAVGNLDLAPVVPFSMATNLRHYVDVHSALKARDTAIDRLQKIQKMHVAPRLVQPMTFPNSGDIPVLALLTHYLNCELWDFIDPTSLASAEAEWLEALFRTEPAAWSSAQFLVELQRFGESLAVKSHRMRRGDIDCLAQAISSVRVRIEQMRLPIRAEKGIEARLLTQLGQQTETFGTLVSREIGRAPLIGKPFAGLADVRWVSQETEPGIGSRVVVVHLWNPFSGAGRESINVLKEWTGSFNSKGVIVASIVPACGFTWNSEKRTIAQKTNGTVDDESGSWSRFLKDRDLTFPVGILGSAAQVWDLYGFQGRPVTVVVGPDGTVREVFEGIERVRIQQVSDYVLSLRREGDDM